MHRLPIILWGIWCRVTDGIELSEITTNHADLCFKLLQNGINVKLVNVTKDTHSKEQRCVMIRDKKNIM